VQPLLTYLLTYLLTPLRANFTTALHTVSLSCRLIYRCKKFRTRTP